jgi:hypothetical protein
MTHRNGTFDISEARQGNDCGARHAAGEAISGMLEHDGAIASQCISAERSA